VKALIKVGYGCNDHCTFCHTLDVRHVDAPADEIDRKIDRARALGHTMVVLSGGEPTIRPELVRWARRVAARDMDLGLVTNGRVLSYPAVVAELLALRLRYVYLSLHGGSRTIHNRLVRADAFAETHGALAQLSGHGLDLKVNCVVTLQNVDHLRGVVDAVLPYPDATLKFSMVEPKGGGAALFAALSPRVSDAAARVVDAIEYGLARAGAGGPRFAHGGFPLCLMPGHEHRFADLKTDRFATMIEVGEPDFFPVDDDNKLQPDAACAGCALAARALACTAATTPRSAPASCGRARRWPAQQLVRLHARGDRAAVARRRLPGAADRRDAVGSRPPPGSSPTAIASRGSAPTAATSTTPRSPRSSTRAGSSTSIAAPRTRPTTSRAI
jgi:uncharacterized Fe-S cluster-containing radical SAM superfamily protein